MNHFASFAQSFAKHFFALLFILCAQGLYAQLGTLSVQGVLTKADGTAVDDGSYNIEFSLWKSESSTNVADRVHMETIATQTTGGVYSVILGLGTPFGGAANFAQVYYLGVKYGGTELLPRPRLTSAPYALALLGSTNIFPGTGTVTCDAITVAGAVNIGSATATGALNANHFVASGGAPSSPVAGKGYSFGAGGDADGGLFSVGDNNVGLYANSTKALEANAGGVLIPGVLQVNNGQTVYNGQNVNGQQTVTGNSTVDGNSKANAFRARGGGPGSSGVNNNGYAFEGSNGDNDSGMFSSADGTVSFYGNNTEGMRVQGSLVEIYPRLNVGGELFLYNVQNNIDGHNLEWNPPGKGSSDYRVSINTSTRRFKHNIVPLKEDFSQILHLEPKRYTRTTDPNGPSEIGYIAEEVDSLGMRCLVLYEDANNTIPLSINYKKMVMFTNEIVKVHHSEIEKLKAEVAALNAEKSALQIENNALRATTTSMQDQQALFGKQLDAMARRIQLLETTAGNR